MSANEEEHIYIAALIRRQLHEKLSGTEQAELDAWIGRSERNRQVYDQCLSAEGRRAAFRQLDAFDNHRAYARIKPHLTTKTLARTQAGDRPIAPSVTR